MLVVLWLHPSWVRRDNLQIEAGTKAKLDLQQSHRRARRRGKELSPCCPPGHQEDFSVHSGIFLTTSPSGLAQALVSALVLHRELRTSVGVSLLPPACLAAAVTQTSLSPHRVGHDTKSLQK